MTRKNWPTILWATALMALVPGALSAQERVTVRANAALSIPVLQQLETVAAQTLADGTRRVKVAVSSNQRWELVVEGSAEWRVVGQGSFNRTGAVASGPAVTGQQVELEIRGSDDVALKLRASQAGTQLVANTVVANR